MVTPVHGDAAATPLNYFFSCLFLNIYLKNILSRKKNTYINKYIRTGEAGAKSGFAAAESTKDCRWLMSNHKNIKKDKVGVRLPKQWKIGDCFMSTSSHKLVYSSSSRIMLLH